MEPTKNINKYKFHNKSVKFGRISWNGKSYYDLPLRNSSGALDPSLELDGMTIRRKKK